MPRLLTALEISRARSCCRHTPAGQRDRVIIGLAYGCGMRSREIAAAKVTDLDLSRATITVATAKQRRRRSRTLPIPALVQEDLRGYLMIARPILLAGRDSQLLIIARTQQRAAAPACSTQTIRSRVKRALRTAGVDEDGCCTHALRHAYATHILRALDTTDNLRRVQLLLGHESLSSTGHYLDVQEDELAAAVYQAHPWARARQLTLEEVPRAATNRD